MSKPSQGAMKAARIIDKIIGFVDGITGLSPEISNESIIESIAWVIDEEMSEAKNEWEWSKYLETLIGPYDSKTGMRKVILRCALGGEPSVENALLIAAIAKAEVKP